MGYCEVCKHKGQVHKIEAFGVSGFVCTDSAACMSRSLENKKVADKPLCNHDQWVISMAKEWAERWTNRKDEYVPADLAICLANTLLVVVDKLNAKE